MTHLPAVVSPPDTSTRGWSPAIEPDDAHAAWLVELPTLRSRLRSVGRFQRAEADDASIEDLVAGARRGDLYCWEGLVRRLERVVWKAVHMTTSDRELCRDAFAATWLRLAEHLHRIREPAKLPGWLTTTATNEVRALVRARRPDAVSIDAGSESDGASRLFDLRKRPAGDPGPDEAILRRESQTAVRAAFARLPDDCRQLLTLLVLADPPLSYREVEDLLGRPHGSIGPTRMRCLEKLRRLLAEDPLAEGLGRRSPG